MLEVEHNHHLKKGNQCCQRCSICKLHEPAKIKNVDGGSGKVFLRGQRAGDGWTSTLQMERNLHLKKASNTVIAVLFANCRNKLKYRMLTVDLAKKWWKRR
jgi:hypothetical protein